ncbi:MAG: hypothetical protein LBV52_00875 [Spirochaetaceae bacterium]|jgi:hypothetical protein|nr:hypothetical protein [Spirochaetaceae bacterium]
MRSKNAFFALIRAIRGQIIPAGILGFQGIARRKKNTVKGGTDSVNYKGVYEKKALERWIALLHPPYDH